MSAPGIGSFVIAGSMPDGKFHHLPPQCPSCHHLNRQLARFCDSCGGRLGSLCPACGQPARATADVCDSCGARLTHGLTNARETEAVERRDGE